MAKKIIPRTLHYAWLGGNEKPPMVQKCIDSWRQHMSTWELIEWNESNFPVSDYPFVEEAIRRKRYAFATDIIRLWCLYTQGGVYLDSDVYVVKPLDKFLSNKAFTGCETSDLWVTAVMGSVPGHEWVKLLLDYYQDRPYSEQTNTSIISQLSKPLLTREDAYGYKYLRNDVVIYPTHIFCSFNHQILEVIPHKDAYAYHLFLGSWTGRKVRDVEIKQPK